MLASVALLVCQVRVVDWPFSTVLGFAVSEAVGAADGGGGGGGGGATFFLMAPNANTSIIHLIFCCVTLSSVLFERIYRCARLRSGEGDFRPASSGN